MDNLNLNYFFNSSWIICLSHNRLLRLTFCFKTPHLCANLFNIIKEKMQISLKLKQNPSVFRLNVKDFEISLNLEYCRIEKN